MFQTVYDALDDWLASFSKKDIHNVPAEPIILHTSFYFQSRPFRNWEHQLWNDQSSPQWWNNLYSLMSNNPPFFSSKTCATIAAQPHLCPLPEIRGHRLNFLDTLNNFSMHAYGKINGLYLVLVFSMSLQNTAVRGWLDASFQNES